MNSKWKENRIYIEDEVKEMSVQFIVDEKGKKTGVFLSLEDYEQLLKIVEEYEDIKDFDERMKDPEWESFDEVNRRLRVSD